MTLSLQLGPCPPKQGPKFQAVKLFSLSLTQWHWTSELAAWLQTINCAKANPPPNSTGIESAAAMGNTESCIYLYIFLNLFLVEGRGHHWTKNISFCANFPALLEVSKPSSLIHDFMGSDEKLTSSKHDYFPRWGRKDPFPKSSQSKTQDHRVQVQAVLRADNTNRLGTLQG